MPLLLAAPISTWKQAWLLKVLNKWGGSWAKHKEQINSIHADPVDGCVDVGFEFKEISGRERVIVIKGVVKSTLYYNYWCDYNNTDLGSVLNLLGRQPAVLGFYCLRFKYIKRL